VAHFQGLFDPSDIGQSISLDLTLGQLLVLLLQLFE
jgi:hypothetical protein